MPIPKLQAPNDARVYDPAHGGARHTLFAGTTVLQAGASANEEVLAVVTATGLMLSVSLALSLSFSLSLSVCVCACVPAHVFVYRNASVAALKETIMLHLCAKGI